MSVTKNGKITIDDKTNLKNIIKENKKEVSDWRKYFLSNPNLIYYLSGYIYFENNHNMIYLLNASRYSVKALELRTLLLHRKLANLGISTLIEYKQEFGKSIISEIGKKKSRVIYKFNSQDNFTIIERGKENTVFTSEKKLIDYIVTNYLK